MNNLEKVIHIRIDRNLESWLEEVSGPQKVSGFVRDKLVQLQQTGKATVSGKVGGSTKAPQSKDPVLQISYEEISKRVEGLVRKRIGDRIAGQLQQLGRKRDMESSMLRTVLQSLQDAIG